MDAPGVPATMTVPVSTPQGDGWTELRERPVPEPAADEALLEVRAVSINRGELALVRTREDFHPGQDLSGVVVSAAADGSGPGAGERVVGLADWHAWAPYAAVPTDRLAPLPDAVDHLVAAALPMAGTTALNVLRAGGRDLIGRNVLVTGARGGVGGLAVQLAAIGGANVTATSAIDAGAPGEQDLILESVGGASLGHAIGKLARDGVVVVFGNSSQERSSIDFRDFGAGHERARIQPFFSYLHTDRIGANLRILTDLVAGGRLAVEIGYEGSIGELDAALDAFDRREFGGKAVLRVI